MGEESNGIKLIASHLAQVKLEAAEKEYESRVRINELEKALVETADRLDAATSDIANYKAQIKQLQSENTYKALVAEREKWKSLIDTLRKDKAKLKEEIEVLKSQEQGVENHSRGKSGNQQQEQRDDEDDEEEAEEKEVNGSNNNNNMTQKIASKSGGVGITAATTSASGVVAAPVPPPSSHHLESEWIQLQGEVKFLKHELETKDIEIKALRMKLDRELELKWERERRVGGWQKSLLESFAEVLVPFPDSPPTSPPKSLSSSSPSGGGKHVDDDEEPQLNKDNQNRDDDNSDDDDDDDESCSGGDPAQFEGDVVESDSF